MDPDAIALFRYQVISPLLSIPPIRGALKEEIERQAQRRHPHAVLGQCHVMPGTIEEWYYLYRHYGIEGLRPKTRKDKGRSRKVSDQAAELIRQLIEGHPDLDGPGVLAELRARNIEPPSLSTYYRFVKAQGLDRLQRAPRADRRAYAFELPGDCWQCDVMYGPMLPGKDGRMRKTYLIAILDDATRLIAHAQFYFDQHLTALKDCIKQALLKRGLPKRLYVDNGRIFRSRVLLLAAAQLGFHLIHSRPYQPEGRAKNERFFGTLRRGFLKRVGALESLAHLNRLLWAWIESKYHQRPHAGLEGATPWSRWIEQAECVRVLPPEADLDWIFLEQTKRRVSKDGTLSVNSVRFEAGVRFIGQKLEIRYDPFDLRRIWLVDEKNERHALRPVDLYANRHAKRQPEERPEPGQKPTLLALEQDAEARDNNDDSHPQNMDKPHDALDSDASNPSEDTPQTPSKGDRP